MPIMYYLLSFRRVHRILLGMILALFMTSLSAAEYAANFKGTDIEEFINIVGKNLNKTIIVDPSVRGKINVRSYDLLNDDQYYQFFLNVLQVYGYAVVEMDNNVLKVIRDKDAKAAAIPVEGDDDGNTALGDEFVTRVVQVHNVSVRELAPLLRQLNDNAGGGNVVHYEPSNVLMLTGRADVVKRLVSIVHRVDTAGDKDVDVVDLKYASAGEMVRIVNNLNKAQEQGANTPAFLQPKLVADDRTNSVLISGDPKARKRIMKLIKRLDRELKTSGNTKVYYLKYAKAKDLVPVLQGVSDSIEADDTKGSTNQGGRSAAGSNRNVSIEAHEESNSLVITAEPDMMQSLESVIRQLDIRRAQVHIEAIIVELYEGDGANLGVQYFSTDGGVMQWNSGSQSSVSSIWAANREAEPTEQGSVTRIDSDTGDPITQENPEEPGDYTALSDVLGSINGMMLGVLKNDWAAVVQAVRTSTNSNVLSTPSITTLDNQEANIIVGQDVPVLTGSTASSSNDNPFQTIEREEVGIKLKVTPQINEGDAVQMKIEQEVSSVSGTTSVDITINKRQLTTTVMADDGATIVLGGLIDEDTEESVSKVPLLGDIPIIGNLFKSRSNTKTKRNLVVFLRPTIIRDGTTMNYLSNRKYNYIRAQQLEQYNRGDIPLLDDEKRPVLPEWNDALALPPSFEEYLKDRKAGEAPQLKGKDKTHEED